MVAAVCVVMLDSGRKKGERKREVQRGCGGDVVLMQDMGQQDMSQRGARQMQPQSLCCRMDRAIAIFDGLMG